MNKFNQKHRYSKGFTLIELMIVVLILGILSSIAIPSYRDYVLRSKRVEAQSALLNFAAQQERYFSRTNAYGSLNDVGMPASTENGLYALSVVRSAFGGVPNLRYTLTATAQNTQANDSACAVITLTSTGVKGGTTAGECW